MANKKVSQLTSKPSVLVTDLFPIADPTTGQLFKTTISALGTAIGSGVSSVNTLVGAVVLDTDDIQELASPTNKWYTDTRSRAAISGGTGISYNSGTGVITNAVTSGQIATALGYTPADDALVVKLAGSQTITGTKTFQQAPLVDIGVGFKDGNGVYNTMQSLTTGWQMPVNGRNHNLIFSTASNYVYTFPNASGTIALTSDLTPYALDNTVVKLTGAQTVAGIKTMSNVFKLDDTLQIKNIAQLSNNTGYTGVWAETAAIGFYTGANAIRLLYAGNYNYTMPSADGTLALTSQLSSYLPLSGGTLTGALSGTSATFSGNIRGAKLSLGTATTTYPINVEDGTQSNSYFTLFNTIGTAGATAGLRFGIANGTLTTGGAAEIVARGLTASDAAMDLKVMYNYSLVNALTLGSNGAATFSSSVTATQFNASISTSGAVASVPNLAYFKNQGSGYVAKIAIGEGTTSDSYISHTGGNTTATQLLGFGVNAYNQMVLTGAGNVGIGTTAPSALLHLQNSAGSTLRLVRTSNRFDISADNDFMEINARDASTYMTFKTADTERMRITSGGLLYVNTSSGDGQISVDFNANNTSGIAYKETATVSNAAFCVFKNNGGTEIGSIRRITTTNAIGFNTTSDYRLKEDLKPINGLELVNKIKVYDYKWKSHDSRMDGVMAHELAEVLPYAVTGVKDGEQMQQVDYSKIVPVMVQAIKELKKELDTLKNK